MSKTESKQLREKIIRKEIDPNTAESFFGDAIKTVLYYLNKNVSLRGKSIPHFIISTGDDTMYRELLGYSYSATEVTDENFIYNEIPRCIVDVSDIQIMRDQLTQPYTRGVFEIEDNGSVYEFSSEIMRLPVNISMSLKYYLDSFTDCLMLTQYMLSNLFFHKEMKFAYMGNEVSLSIEFLGDSQIEKPTSLSFDTESRYKTLSFDVTLETNLPVFQPVSCIETSAVISKYDNNIGKKVTDGTYVSRGYDDKGNPV